MDATNGQHPTRTVFRSRRRKRAAPPAKQTIEQDGKPAAAATSTHEFEFYHCAHSTSLPVRISIIENSNKRTCPLQKKDAAMKKREAVMKSIPALLYRREIGARRLKDPIYLCQKESSSHHYKWRNNSKRRIPFSKLKTPATDAVLALDRTGSFLISIGDGRRMLPGSSCSQNEENTNMFGLFPDLSLRFYGKE